MSGWKRLGWSELKTTFVQIHCLGEMMTAFVIVIKCCTQLYYCITFVEGARHVHTECCSNFSRLLDKLCHYMAELDQLQM